jgi:hypothetical protein
MPEKFPAKSPGGGREHHATKIEAPPKNDREKNPE